ncbi:HTH-type transcriptional regulator CymR [Botrimarina colliarenosi]|uniref:HTH-type transcriptional regulator CymR n=1 Tax=Botrimarina colliarenosi TaxID=2528001 RepID=A0A5C6AIR5_9BACT|nr:Rrf2 family transcriptional regulator [Botrimarina colliarenosi]TWT99904.1 HTH-type transcriptional regulator CymR [Botrimarina colliarenosi]
MLSAKTEYACLALARLASEYAGGQPLQGRRIAAEEGIPEGFLVQILQELKRLGLVTSTRGACGGYRLAREPEELSLGEVIDLVDGPPTGASNVTTPTPLGEAVTEAISESALAERERLRGVTLAEITAQATAHGAMFYI